MRSSPGTAFQEFVPGVADVRRLTTAVSGSRSAGAQTMQVLARWSGSRPADAASVSEWLEPHGGHAPTLLHPVALAVRDVFVAIADRELQALYARRLAPVDLASLTHAERVALVADTAASAAQVVEQFDWQWLARWVGHPASCDVRGSLLRLSNFAFRLRRVNFRFTYHCNISCRHCYNSSGPLARAAHLSTDAMTDIIQQMPAVGIDTLNLTGGEPFLYLDAVVALVRAGRRAGLREISIYTNGFWGTSDERADAVFDALVDAGFMASPDDFLKLSAGDYHQEFLTLESLVPLVRRYHQRFGQRLVVDYEAAEPDGTSRARAHLAALGVGDYVRLFVRDVLPMGRGRDLTVTTAGVPDLPCDAIDQIVFDPDGAVRPCCGLNNENRGVVIGAMGDHSLRDLIKRMQNDPVLHYLSSVPMPAWSSGDCHASDGASAAAGPCDLCQRVVGEASDKEALQRRLLRRQPWYPFWFESDDEGVTVIARCAG